MRFIRIIKIISAAIIIGIMKRIIIKTTTKVSLDSSATMKISINLRIALTI